MNFEMDSLSQSNKMVEIFGSDIARSQMNHFSFSQKEEDALILLKTDRKNRILDCLLKSRISDSGKLMHSSLCAILSHRLKSQVEVPYKMFHGTPGRLSWIFSGSEKLSSMLSSMSSSSTF